jgi:hypothetical protein
MDAFMENIPEEMNSFQFIVQAWHCETASFLWMAGRMLSWKA